MVVMGFLGFFRIFLGWNHEKNGFSGCGVSAKLRPEILL